MIFLLMERRVESIHQKHNPNSHPHSEQTVRLGLTSGIQPAQPTVHQRVKISTHDSECSSFSCKYLLSWQNSAAIEYHVPSTSRPPDTQWSEPRHRMASWAGTTFSFVSNGNKTGQRGKYFHSRKTEPDSQVLLGSGCRSSSADPSRSSASICQRVHAGWRQSVRQKWRFGGCKRRVGTRPSVPGCSLAEGIDICRRCQTVLCLFCLHRYF